MKKTHTLLLALFLCLALIFPCALAEDAYVPGQRTQALIDAAGCDESDVIISEGGTLCYIPLGTGCRRRNAPDPSAWRRNALHAGGRRGEPGAA